MKNKPILNNCKVKTLKSKARRPPRKERARLQRGKSQNATPKRHTHSTIVGLEDLTAILVDMSFILRRISTFLQAAQNEVEAMQERCDAALDTIHVVRAGPHAYPVEGKVRNRTIKTKRRE